MIPEFHPAASDVEVCDVESVFLHVTVVPTATFNSPGEKARFPSDSAPTGIVTDAEGPSGAGAGAGGDGDGAGDGAEGEESPHAVANTSINETRTRRDGNIGSSMLESKRFWLNGSAGNRPSAHTSN
jgi:hypothetical protein